LEKIGIGILIFLCVSAFIQNLYWPIRYWDSLVLYDFRAKVFAATGFMQPAISRGYFFGYPLLTSLAHAWVYILGGTNPSFLYTFFYISFLLNFGINIKKMGLSRPLVIAMTVLVSISPRLFEHTQWAYTNLPYIIYIVLGSIYLYWGIKNNDIKAYLLSGIMVGLSTWTRNVEPFWLSVLIVAMVSTFFNKRWFWFVMMTSLVFIIMMPWRIFESFYKQGAGINVASQIINTSKGIVQNTNPTIFKSSLSNFWANFIFPYVFYVVIFTIVLFFKIINKSKNLYFIFIVILDLGLILGGIFTYVTYVPYVGDLSDSLTRMAMFFQPLVVFLLSEYLSETKS
jgi:hypothetical protein